MEISYQIKQHDKSINTYKTKFLSRKNNSKVINSHYFTEENNDFHRNEQTIDLKEITCESSESSYSNVSSFQELKSNLNEYKQQSKHIERRMNNLELICQEYTDLNSNKNKNETKSTISSFYLSEERLKIRRRRKELDLLVCNQTEFVQINCQKCVDEANEYSKLLGETTNFALCRQDNVESLKLDPIFAKNSVHNNSKDIPFVTCAVSSKTAPCSLFTFEQFMVQHKRLHARLRSHFSLLRSPLYAVEQPDGRVEEENKQISINKQKNQQIQVQLSIVLENAVLRRRSVEEQMNEIRSRGWNLGCS